ncbi:MAG: calcium/sodium antiporter [Nitrospiraceae bacterium]|nr:calcium/sodium antiporter [Nitrospiraceae bacterium]
MGAWDYHNWPIASESMPALGLSTLALISGLILLSGGAEALTNGSVGIAHRLGVSSMVIGLTIVAFGTSTPEMGVSISAALSGSHDITMGNIVGSNIANIGLVLGIGAVLTPLKIEQRMLKIEIPLLIAVSLIVWVFAAKWHLGRLAGLLLLSVFTVYCLTLYWHSKKEPYAAPVEFVGALNNKRSLSLDFLSIILGLLALILGSKLLVWGAKAIAIYLGISELVIGLTLTAVGTSLPELATTVAAARKGEGDLILGNVVGSNLANLCLVIGVTACITPIKVNPEILHRDLPVMMAFTLILLPLMRIGMKVSRWDGLVLLILYVIYIASLAGG